MKCLTILQPYADLIASKDKTLEIRSWKTNYRGEIVICAGKQNHRNFIDYQTKLRGKTLCIVKLIDVIEFQKRHEKRAKLPYIANHYAWVLDYIKKIPYLDIIGKQGLFEPPTYLKEAVKRL